MMYTSKLSPILEDMYVFLLVNYFSGDKEYLHKYPFLQNMFPIVVNMFLFSGDVSYVYKLNPVFLRGHIYNS